MKELKGSENSDEIDASLNSILIAEHARLSSLYQYNAGMGEKLITTYLTIISIVVGLFISIPQLIPLGSNSITIELTLIILAFVIGCITFLRLIERRGRSVEYLRGINRIHRFYVDHFPEIEEHLTWDACDDCPPMGVKGTSIGGLRDMEQHILWIWNRFDAQRSISPNNHIMASCWWCMRGNPFVVWTSICKIQAIETT
jgi:hypothetical protein